MTKANECTCPSGDGSLRHPCPAHPVSVEQAGGDERVIGWRERILAAHPNSDPGFWPDALLVEHMAAEIADLRAALAQPSPAQDECIDCHGSGFCMSISNEEIRCPCGAPIKFSGPAQAEQAEAERPEVVGSLYLGGWADQEELEDNDVELDMKVVERLQVDMASKGDGVHMPLMTVAQHGRIVGALRAENAKLSEALDECDGDRWKLRSERDAANARLHEVATACATAEQQRDAALAEVERLRQFERICEGLPQDAIDGGWTVQGIRGYAKRLEDQLKVALARVAELELKLDQSDYAYDNDRHHMRGMAKQAAEAIQVFTGHDSGANLAHRYGEKWWEHLDELRDALLAFAKNAPPTQAQHSVPELLVRAEDFVSGFEDDDEQEGVSQLLADLRLAIGRAK